MIIDQDACRVCGKCAPYCPVGAIVIQKRDKAAGIEPRAEIDQDCCVECGVCYRAGVCSSNALIDQILPWPRVLRKAFSDPLYVHEGTDVPGRGTEEMKTNDLTHRFQDGYLGVGLEFGRPGVATRLGDTEPAIRKLLALGVVLEPLNSLTQLIANPETGELRKDVVGERVLSAIVECIIPTESAQEVLAAVREIAGEIDTVFTLDVISKVAPDGSIPAAEEMRRAGLTPSLNGKVNVGLGRWGGER